ncbi:flavin reductase [Afipia sp. P52-10]|uniref:flavin reductase family protein n=1 Tax=Afipia sp. P52-10 TaxID=1429916 RepID=UPI0003DF09B1|nr:flavin reductase family protein [Afipia sp. P52-10]ETR78782.1 flavin reductase [Afipia sp. P52-10]
MSRLTDLGVAEGVDVDAFKAAMRQLPGGVTIITAGRDGEISGMTVSSFVSLSVDPPTVMVSVNRQSSSWPLIQKRGVFGANILAADQTAIADRFSGKGGLHGPARFDGGEWMVLASGVPLLRGALAAIDCEVEHVIHRHSHVIIIGRVLELQTSAGQGALAYWNGRYVAIDNEAADDHAAAQRRLLERLTIAEGLV